MANGFGINPLIAMQAQAPDVGGALNNALMNINAIEQMKANRAAAAQAAQLAPMQQQLLEGKVEAQDIQLARARDQQELESIFRGVEMADLTFKRGGRDQLRAFLENRVANGPTVEGGRGMVDTQDLLLKVNDPAFSDQDIQKELDDNRAAGVQLGFIKAPEVSKLRMKQLEELRGTVRKRNEQIDKDVSAIKTTEKNIIDLAKNVKDGNRNAVSSLMVKLVKSQDPNSAVLAGEMLAAMNIQGYKELLASGNFNPDEISNAIAQEIAALDPNQVNLADVLDVAESNLGARVGSIADANALNEEVFPRLSPEGRRDLDSPTRSANVAKLTSGRTTPLWFDVVGATENDINELMQKGGYSREDAINRIGQFYRIYGGR